MKEWATASDLAVAYNVGRTEAQAAWNLLSCIDASVTERLTVLVKNLA